jgi:hypothetical protein
VEFAGFDSPAGANECLDRHIAEAGRGEQPLAERAVPLEEALAESAERSKARKLAGEVASGLEAIAVMVRANPQLAERLAWGFRPEHTLIPVMHEENPAAVLAEFVTAASRSGARVAKDGSENYFKALLSWGPVGLQVYANREQVCERVVVGTETVIKTVKDPVALAAVPEVEVTEEVEQVEWRCRPLLAADESVSAAAEAFAEQVLAARGGA